MAPVTSRLIIVCPPDQRASANQTLNAISDATGGTDTIVARLTSAADPSGPTVAYWANWAMDDATRGDVMSAVRSNQSPFKPRLNNAELTIYEPPTVPAWGSQRVYLFNGATWDQDALLAALGLSRPLPAD